MPLRWLTRDSRTLILASTVSAVGQGFLSVVLAVYLAKAGLGLVQIGAYFSAGAAGAAFFTFAVAFVSERLGRRRLLVALTLAAGPAGLALILTDNVFLLGLFAFVGALSVSGSGGTGAVQPLVQASLAEAAPDGRRTDLFAAYRMANTFARAVGALSAGLPVLLQSAFGIGEMASFKVMFGAFVVSLLLVAGLYSSLSRARATDGKSRGWTNPLRLPSRRIIFTLSALFTADSLGGALLLQSLVAYWFSTRFGLELGPLALVFFGSELLTATSLWVSARLAARIGLLNTMVFTHIPASLFLLGAAFAPTAWVAIIFWQLRAFFSQMDVPTRDSYIMAVVGPEERVVMASMQMLGRSAATTVGPTAAAALWTAVSASAPFIACSGIKIAYDLSLWFMFRNIKPPEETERAGARPRLKVTTGS